MLFRLASYAATARIATLLATLLAALFVGLLGAVSIAPASAEAPTRAGPPIASATGTASVTDHGPHGTMRDALQVRLRFSADMAALGDGKAVPAAEVRCDMGATAKGRWIDPRLWVAEFDGVLPDGVRCRVTPTTTLRTIDQGAVNLPAPWSFDTGGPRLKSWLSAAAPGSGLGYGQPDRIKEVPLLALAGSARIASESLRHLHCEVNGAAQRVHILQGDVRRHAAQTLLANTDEERPTTGLDDIASRLGVPPQNIIVTRCGDLPQFPADATVRWIWGKEIATPTGLTSAQDHVLTLRVRPAFTALLRCQQLAGSRGCDPRRDLTLEFSAPVDKRVLQTVRLLDGDAKRSPSVDTPPEQRTLRSLRFAGPFAEGATLRLQLPNRLQDADGRPLHNMDETAATISIARLPAYLGMPESRGVLRWPDGQAQPAQWAVALRNTEPSVTVRRWQLDSRASNATLIALQRQAAGHDDNADLGTPWTTPFAASTKLLNHLQIADGAQTLRIAPDGNAMQFTAIPLPGPGTWLVEADSPAYRDAVTRQYEAGPLSHAQRTDKAGDPADSVDQEARRRQLFRTSLARGYAASRLAVVQVSNLNLHARLAPQGQSLAWVTSLRTGAPLAGIDVQIVDCEARVHARGRSDAQGRMLFALPRDGVANCDTGRINLPFSRQIFPQPQHGLWVIARHGADVAVLDARMETVPDARATVHAVLDRPLFNAGESVSMAFIARQPTASGWTIPAPFNGRLKIHYNHSELIEERPLQWDATGHAQASWPIPASAKLGRYRYEIDDAAGKVLGGGEFSVEEFRTPAFEARLTGSPAESGTGAALRIEARLAFLSGGAAAGETVHLSHAVTGVTQMPGYPGYQFGRSDLKLGQPQSAIGPQSLKLDADGALQTRVPMPAWGRPLAVHSEMTFADANGESQTVAAQTHLFSSKENIGIKFEAASRTGQPRMDQSRSTPNRLTVLALDATARPLAGREIRLTLQQARIDYRSMRIIPGEAAPVPVCTVRSDAAGLGECPFEQASLRGDAQSELLVRAITDGQVRTAMLIPRWHFNQQEDKPVLQRVRTEAPMPGDEDEWLLRAPFLPATVLLTVEREQVMHSEVFSVSTAEHRLRLPIKADFIPGAQIRAVLVPVPQTAEANLDGSQKMTANAAADSEPARSLATESSLLLHPDSRQLAVEVMPAIPVSEPGKTVKARIKVRDARTGQVIAGSRVTLAVVDDALLQLKPNPSWQVLPAFWQLRHALVHGTTLDQQLHAAFPAGPQTGFLPGVEALLSEAGAAPQARMMAMHAPAPAPVGASAKLAAAESASADAAPEPRSRFSTLALWQTELFTDAGGVIEIDVPLPDALTRWRLVAIATAENDRFGTGESTLMTRKTLQIIAGLPPLLRSDDRVIQRITLRNTGDAPVNLRFSAEARLQADAGNSDAARPGPVLLPVEAAEARGLRMESRLRLNAGENRTLQWPVAVPDGISALHWDITVHGTTVADALPAGGDRLLVVQQITPAIPVTVRDSTLLQLDQPHSVPVAQPAGARPGLGGIRVSLQDSLARAALGGVRDWMQAYPYTCLEQLASKAVVSGEARQWQELVRTLPDYLDGNDLLRYFQSSSLSGSATLSAFMLDLAAGAGLPLPDDLRARLLRGIEATLNGNAASPDWLPDATTVPGTADPASIALTAYRLALQATLAESGTGRKPAQAIVPTDLNALPSVALLDWVRYLRTLADTPERQQQLAQAAQQMRSRYVLAGSRMNWRHSGDQGYWWMMWNRDVAAARMALLVQQWGRSDPLWRDEAPRIVRGLVDLQQNGRWSTTVANAWGFLALQAFARDHEAVPVQGWVSASLAPSHAGAAGTAGTPGAPQRSAWPDAPALHFQWPRQGDRSVLSLQQEGAGAPWATVSIHAAIPATAAVAHGLKVSREVLPVQRKAPGKWSVGDVYQVTLRMTAESDMGWVVVRDPIPSGASILGKGLERESQLMQRQGPRQTWWQPTMVERANESYRGYYARVWRGTWETSYRVRLNNAGSFSLPPTRIESMYASDIFGEVPNEGLAVAD